MKRKKLLSAVLVTTLATSMMLAGCGNDEGGKSSDAPSSSTPTGSGDASTPAATGGEESNLLDPLSADEQGKPGLLTTPRSNYVQYPIEGAEGVKLQYWMPVPGNVANNPETADSVQMTQWAQLWQEKTGVEIEFIGPTSNNDEAFNLMTTGTDLPDIIEWEWTASYAGGPAKAEEEGVLIYLDEYITPDGPAADLWQYLQDNPTLDQAVKTDDGHYYGFPFTRGHKYLQTTSGPIVRKDLLEALNINLDEIVTIDDWTEMLTALKESGVQKPLTTQNWANLQAATLPAYGLRAGMYVDFESGKVMYGEIQEGYKAWLQQMVDWKNAGLLDPDTLTNDSKTRQANMLTSKDVSATPISAVTYGAGGGQIGTWNRSAWKEPDTYGEKYELTGIQFPVLKEGDAIHYAGGSTDYAISSKATAVITADCEHPEIAAAFMNFCYSQAGHEIINFGIEGTDYTRNADGTITYSDWIMNNPDLSIAVAMANKGRANMSGAFVQDPNYIIAYWNTEQQSRALHMWNDETDVQMTIMPPVTLTAEEASEYSRIMADVTTAVKEYYAKVFNGEANLEADWDAYIKQLEGMNIARAVEIEQAALDRYNAR